MASSRTAVLPLEHAQESPGGCAKPQMVGLSPELLVHEVWDGAPGYTFLTSSLKRLMVSRLEDTLEEPLFLATQGVVA